MAELRRFPVFSSVGKVGEILAHSRFLDDRPEKILRLADGTEKKIPADALEIRDDGSFYLRQPDVLNRSPKVEQKTQESAMATDSRIPTTKPSEGEKSSARENAGSSQGTVNQPIVARAPQGGRIQSESASGEKMQPVSLPAGALFENGFTVETVRVDRIVNEPVEQRHEGDVLILPVLEEVWVFEKKLMLREEIRITPRKTRVENIRAIEKQ